MKKCNGSSMITIVAVGLLSAGLAMLFAPYKGKKCRKKLKSALKCNCKVGNN